MWAALLLAMEAEQTGPDDDADPDVNNDPSSTLGEDDETGAFDEMADWPDEMLDDDGGDDGFEDAGESADDEDDDEDDDDSDGDDAGGF